MLEFTEAEIPTVQRTSEPNPFTDHFPTKEGRALSVVVPGVNGEPDTKTIEKIKRQARAAATSLPEPKSARVSVTRVKTAKGENAKSGDSTLHIWTGELIVRPRKPKDEDVSSPDNEA